MKKLFFILFLFPSISVLAQDDSLKNIYSISDPTLSKLRVICKDWEKADSVFKFASLYSRVKDLVGVLQIEIQDRERSIELGIKESWMKFFGEDIEKYTFSLCNFIKRHPNDFPGIEICDHWAMPFPVLSIASFKILADSSEEEETDNDFCNFLELAYGDYDDGTEISANWKTKFFDGNCNALILEDVSVMLMLELSAMIREEENPLIPEVNKVLDVFAEDLYGVSYFTATREIVLEQLKKFPPFFKYANHPFNRIKLVLEKVEEDSPLLYYESVKAGLQCE